MKITVDIDEKELQELVTEHLTHKIVESHYMPYEIKKQIGEAIKEYIYSNKEEIIERVVDRASREIVKKGLPKLLERV